MSDLRRPHRQPLRVERSAKRDRHRGIAVPAHFDDRGFECLLVADATESYFPAFKQATLDMVRAQGAIVGWTATIGEVLAALQTA